nr:helix-turn-helix transcriptional regulator [Sphingomonas melonis]
MSQVERAQANPTLDLMAKIAEVLDTDVWDLLRPNND